MSIFYAYMAKHCNSWQNQQADSWVPRLEKDLEKARLKWVDLASAEVKKVPKLKAELEELRQNISKLRNIYQTKVEGLCTAHQAQVERLRGLHAAENIKPLSTKLRRCGCYQNYRPRTTRNC